MVRNSLGLDPQAGLRLDFYPRPPNLFDYILGRAEPFLPLRIRLPLEDLVDDGFQLLELPPELVRMVNPF